MHTKANKISRIITILTLVFSLGFSACTEKKQVNKNPKYGGTLHVNLNGAPDHIFPGQVLKNSEQIITTQVYDGLIKYDPLNLEIVPSIAKKWLIEREGTIYTFFLNSEARFHNDKCFKNGKGRQITAYDFKYSIEQMCRNFIKQDYVINKQFYNLKGFDEFYASEIKQDTAEISGISVFNDTTIIFRLKESDPMFIHFLAGTNGLVFPKEAFEAYGIESMVGSGAFLLTIPENKAKSVVLKANPNYFLHNKQNEQLPFLDSIYITFITSTQQELNLFKRGQIDAVLSLPQKYVTSFLDEYIDEFQSNPPYYVMRQTTDYEKNTRYNLLRSNVQSLELNAQGFYDFSIVYFEEPKEQTIELIK